MKRRAEDSENNGLKNLEDSSSEDFMEESAVHLQKYDTFFPYVNVNSGIH